MRKIACVLLTIVFVCTLIPTTFATEKRSDESKLFNKIDVYITQIDEKLMNDIDIDSIDYMAIYNDSIGQSSNKNTIRVTRIEDAETASYYEPLINATYESIAHAESKGLIVKSVNIIIPYRSEGNISTKSESDYWRQNSTWWGVYNGQEIRYYWHTITFLTPFVDANNVPSTWPAILKASLKVIVDQLVGASRVGTIYNTISNISTVLGAATPKNYYYDSANEWVRAQSVGSIYYRNIVLEDVDNKISGYTFYPWGHVERDCKINCVNS